MAMAMAMLARVAYGDDAAGDGMLKYYLNSKHIHIYVGIYSTQNKKKKKKISISNMYMQYKLF